MFQISASIVMYTGAQEVYRCLASLAQHTKQDSLQLYLIDNASPDQALQQLEQMGIPENVQVLPLPENRGYGSGHNAALPLLQSQYHAVVNPDIEVSSDVLGAMARWMQDHPDVVIATPKLLSLDGSVQHIGKRRPALLPLVYRQTHLSFLKKYETHYLMLDEDLSQPIDVEFCSGSFFMIRTDVYKEFGGFDEKYFMYVEDADITQKALQYGRAVFLPQVEVTHAWHRAAHKNPRQFLWQLKSMGRYFRKWGFRLGSPG